MATILLRCRRWLAYRILPRSDRHKISTALANGHAYLPGDDLFEMRRSYNALLRDMESIY